MPVCCPALSQLHVGTIKCISQRISCCPRQWIVTGRVPLFCLSDQRVASFCTMTDMQRAEALQISRELTRRVVEAEGAALDAE